MLERHDIINFNDLVSKNEAKKILIKQRKFRHKFIKYVTIFIVLGSILFSGTLIFVHSTIVQKEKAEQLIE